MNPPSHWPSVRFHVNAPDPIDYAVRLLRKAYSQEARVQVLISEEDAVTLDKALWAVKGADFIAHEIWTAQDAHLGYSPPFPIGLDVQVPHVVKAPVIVNLCSTVAPIDSTVEKIIEIVSTDTHALEQARQRWRTYVKQGIKPQRHEVTGL